MNQLLLLAGVVIVACILMNRIAAKLPLPSLLLFIGLGMCFGVDGFFKIPFDDYELSEAICSVSLLFVMFYGGFGTNLKTAKPVMGKAFLLSTAGVVMTAALVGAAAHVLLGVGWMEGILIGSVIASTDAASVFNVLRSKQLSLKYNTEFSVGAGVRDLRGHHPASGTEGAPAGAGPGGPGHEHHAQQRHVCGRGVPRCRHPAGGRLRRSPSL